MKHFIGFQIMNLLNSSLSNYLCFMWVISSYVIDSNGPIRWTFWWFFKVPPVDKPYVFSYVELVGNQKINSKMKIHIRECFWQCFIDLGIKYKTRFLNLITTRRKWYVCTKPIMALFNEEWQYGLKNARFKLNIFKANIVPVQNQPN